jgi:ketosteroid isomerase-like protein
MCPCLDATCNSNSMHELAEGYMLSRGLMQWFWECYVSSPEQLHDPLVSPVFATQLAGLPPASISTAEYDPLRDEAEQYADHLRAAGVPVVVRRYNGMIHDFMQQPLVTDQARNGIADVAGDLRAALARPAGGRVATAQQLYRLALSGDFAGVEALLTEDFVIREAADLPFAGTFSGRGALRELLTKVGAMLKLKDVRIGSFAESGDCIIVPIDLVVEAAGPDGARVEVIPLLERLRFRGGLICELQPFYFDASQVRACVQR